MKMFILLSLISLSLTKNTLASDTIVITSHPEYGASLGFSDSSFNYPASLQGEELQEAIRKVKHCYVGNSQEVCAHIKAQVWEMNARYSGGAHDSLHLYSCNVSAGSATWDWDRDNSREGVNVNYRLQDDYGSDMVVERNIYPCPKS